MTADTIFALASGRGRAGIAVLRVSGPEALGSAKQLTGEDLPVRRATRVRIIGPDTGEVLDQGLALFFPGPASFTGEDVVEFHVHGGLAVIQGVLEALGRAAGLRLAEPGEFTRRGFLNGKFDLTAAEGLADLVDAETAEQRRQALRQMGGALAEFSENCRTRLVAALAHWEAAIDFSDEELPEDLEFSVVTDVSELIRDISVRLDDGGSGERLRHGVEVAIVGPPNAGKSGLLNLLAKRDAAIVSDTAGTTRDIIEVHFELGGYPVILADTAGLRESGDEIEREGVRRALERADKADVRIILLDGAVWPEVNSETRKLASQPGLTVINKTDLISQAPPSEIDGQKVLAMSVKTGDGVENMMKALEGLVAEGFQGITAPVVTRHRHRQALNEAREALERFIHAKERLEMPELSAEDLRLAGRALGRIAGTVDAEDLLGIIFADFCIGK